MKDFLDFSVIELEDMLSKKEKEVFNMEHNENLIELLEEIAVIKETIEFKRSNGN